MTHLLENKRPLENKRQNAFLKLVFIVAIFACANQLQAETMTPLGLENANSQIEPQPSSEPGPPQAPALSGTFYVSDNLKTALRTGPSNNHRISAFLASGTPLSVLNSNDDWVEVDVIGTDKSGWVSRLSVQKSLGAKELLIRRDANIIKLNADIADLKQQLNAAQVEAQTLKTNLDQVTDQFDRLNQEHGDLQAVSKDAIRNHNKTQSLREEMAEVAAKHSQLTIAHDLLRQDTHNRGIIHGIIAVIIGVFLALIVPRLKPRSRSNRW